MEESVFQRYLESYRKDPKQKIFAAVADGYRERGQVSEAYRIAQEGVQLFPDYPGGWVALGRVQFERGEIEKAIQSFTKAVQLAPDNLLALQLLGDAYVFAKETEKALKSFKLALFLNPNHPKIQSKVQKLETLQSEQWEDELFELKKLTPVTPSKEDSPRNHETRSNFHLERQISYIDALLSRGDSAKARERLEELDQLYPGHPDPALRWQYFYPPAPPTPIRPLPEREKIILDRKKKKLEKILRALTHYRTEGLN